MYNQAHGLVIPDYEPEPTLESITKKDDYLLAAIPYIERRRKAWNNSKLPKASSPRQEGNNINWVDDIILNSGISDIFEY